MVHQPDNQVTTDPEVKALEAKLEDTKHRLMKLSALVAIMIIAPSDETFRLVKDELKEIQDWHRAEAES